MLPYIHERKQFGQPIGEFQLMQGKVADMYTALQACARLRLRGGARPATAGETHARKDAAGVILLCAEKATWMARRGDPGARRQRLHQRIPARPAAARRQALRDRRRHQRDPPHADRPRAVRREHLMSIVEAALHIRGEDAPTASIPELVKQLRTKAAQ